MLVCNLPRFKDSHIDVQGATPSACPACCQPTVVDLCPQGLDAMDYKEHIDYDLVESTNPAFGRAVVRVNVFRNHRQVPLGRRTL